MKTRNYFLIRAVTALIIGLVLVLMPGVAADYLVITIGILFIIPGLFGIIGYFGTKKGEKSPRFPIEAVGSLFLGLWLVIMPDFFVNILMYVLGFVLLLGGLQQVYTLIRARKWTDVPVAFFVAPVLVMMAGLLIVFSPRDSQQALFIIIGATAIVYALAELLNYFRFISRKPKHPSKPNDDITDAEILDDK